MGGGRGKRGKANGGGKGNNGEKRRGYDWRQHIESSDDPAVQGEVWQVINDFAKSNLAEQILPVSKNHNQIHGRVKNTYKRYARDFEGITFVPGNKSNGRISKLKKLPTNTKPIQSLWEEAVKMVGEKEWIHAPTLLIKCKKSSIWPELVSVGITNASHKKLAKLREPHSVDLYRFFHEGDGNNSLEWLFVKARSQVEAYMKKHGDGQILQKYGAKPGKRTKVEFAKPLYLEESLANFGITNTSTETSKASSSWDRNAQQKERKQASGSSRTTSSLLEKLDKALDSALASPDVKRRMQYLQRQKFDGEEANDYQSRSVTIRGELPWKQLANQLQGNQRRGPIPNKSKLYQERIKLRDRLAGYQRAPEFVKAVATNDVVLLCGATGCGKTTQLPQILMEWLNDSSNSSASSPLRILCTQPRRISATSVAERVAYERGENLGQRVGYQIRFENIQSVDNDTDLLYCTVGILLRYLNGNPLLEGWDCVILDEVHERGIQTDFALLILREVIRKRKALAKVGRANPLRIVLMSATIQPDRFIQYFTSRSSIDIHNESNRGTSSAQLSLQYIQIPGKTNYPITEYFAEDILCSGKILSHKKGFVRDGSEGGGKGKGKGGKDKGSDEPVRNADVSVKKMRESVAEHLGLQDSSKISNKDLQNFATIIQRKLCVDYEMIADIVGHIEDEEAMEWQNLSEKQQDDYFAGAVLIFVPGWTEITSTIEALQELKKKRAQYDYTEWVYLPLHSQVPPDDQRKVFKRVKPNQRKIIISTTLAETSVTVEDVVYVIDTGLCKGLTYTPETNIAALQILQIARSNVQQRRGRAGRCRPGKFYQLFSKKFDHMGSMTDHEKPEMMRTPVEDLCLQVKALKLRGAIKDVLSNALDPPEPQSIQNAIDLLESLGAIIVDQENVHNPESLTPLGWKLGQMPCHPSLGKMLLLGNLLSAPAYVKKLSEAPKRKRDALSGRDSPRHLDEKTSVPDPKKSLFSLADAVVTDTKRHLEQTEAPSSTSAPKRYRLNSGNVIRNEWIEGGEWNDWNDHGWKDKKDWKRRTNRNAEAWKDYENDWEHSWNDGNEKEEPTQEVEEDEPVCIQHELLSICSTLSFKSPFVLPWGKEKEADAAKARYGEGLKSDHFLFARVFHDYEGRSGRGLYSWCEQNFLSSKTLEMTQQVHQDLKNYMKDSGMILSHPVRNQSSGKWKNDDEEDDDPLLTTDKRAILHCVLVASLNLAVQANKNKYQGITGTKCDEWATPHLGSLWKTLPKPSKRQWQGTPSMRMSAYFERLQTSELFLFDNTLVQDTLPLFLFTPGLERVIDQDSDDDEDEDEENWDEDGAGFQGGEVRNQNERAKNVWQLSGRGLYLQPVIKIETPTSSYYDEEIATSESVTELLGCVRGKVGKLVDCVIGLTFEQLGPQTLEAISALTNLIRISYKRAQKHDEMGQKSLMVELLDENENDEGNEAAGNGFGNANGRSNENGALEKKDRKKFYNNFVSNIDEEDLPMDENDFDEYDEEENSIDLDDVDEENIPYA